MSSAFSLSCSSILGRADAQASPGETRLIGTAEWGSSRINEVIELGEQPRRLEALNLDDKPLTRSRRTR
jgi:hypothetical protein